MGERVLSISVEEFRKLSTGRRARLRTAKPARPASPAKRESELPLRFSLPFLPPSVNKLFATVRDERSGAAIRVLTAQARRFRKLVCALVAGRLIPGRAYTLDVDVHLPAFTRDGAMRKVDVSNRIKFLEDCICLALGIDDRQFFRVVLTKRHAQTEQTVVTINRYAEAA